MMPFATGLGPSEKLPLLVFLIGLSGILYYLVVTSVRGHSRVSPKRGTIWHHHVPAASTGVDAAEKGDTRRLLLEKVPYDLQKRAILHKVSLVFCVSLPFLLAMVLTSRKSEAWHPR